MNARTAGAVAEAETESITLANSDALATIAVKDLNAARVFYEGTLGLKVLHTEGEEAVEYTSGSSRVLVYRSQYAGTNQATAATWNVGRGLEDLVRALGDRGVKFEHYDMPHTTLKGDLHIAGTHKMAWLKDPDGNILALMGE